MVRMAVAAPSTTVTGAASLTAEAGGSAVDVAIVSVMTAMSTEPGVCAPGGGGFLTIDVPGSPPVVIDGYMARPGLGFVGEARMREIYMEYGGGMTTMVGAGSVAVPGVFAGLEMASDMFGTMPWADLMDIVASTIADGFPLGPAAHRYLVYAFEPIFSQDETIRRALTNNGELKSIGEPVVFEGLAETLRYIGEEGSRVLYEGDLGAAIVGDLADSGGLLTREDLAAYRAIPRQPLSMEAGGWKLDINPPPAVGGVTVALALNEVKQSVEKGPGAWANALTNAFQTRFDSIDRGSSRESSAAEALVLAGLRAPSTISIAVADENGCAVAGTFSAGYGAGVAAAGTGLMLNNSLGEVELVAKVGSPGERMNSNMAPTVARRGRDVVAIGTPGADRITSALVVTLEWLVAGLHLSEAIEHPRVHPEFGDWGIRIAAEPGLDLTGITYTIREFDDLHMYFGGVNGAALEDGELHGHADSRRQGAVALIG